MLSCDIGRPGDVLHKAWPGVYSGKGAWCDLVSFRQGGGSESQEV